MQTVKIDKKRLNQVKKLKLYSGSGVDLKRACVMQMVSYVAGEPWTDRPECACPVLTSFAIRLNDRWDDKTRQRLKPFIPKLVNTRESREITHARANFMVWRSISVSLPILTDALRLTEISKRLRSLKNTVEDFRLAEKYIASKREEIKKAADAAYAAAASADDAAAYAAAAASADDAADYAADAASAAASADDAAYAAADAAYAAAAASADDAAAYAADAASAAADAASAYAAAAKPSVKKKWLLVKRELNDASLETLKMAIKIKEGK